MVSLDHWRGVPLATPRFQSVFLYKLDEVLNHPIPQSLPFYANCDRCQRTHEPQNTITKLLELIMFE